MDIAKIGITAVMTAVFCVLLKRVNGEYAVLCSLCGCAFFMILSSGEIYSLFTEFYSMAERCGIDSDFIGIVLKITGISYIGQISAYLCKDAGESAIAANVELCTKVIVMVVGMPVITSLINVITSIADALP